MLHFLLLLSVTAYAHGGHFSPGHYSAASYGQIKNALENQYDNTGPGSNGPEFAYATYKDLSEALAAYLDDPDTKLPFHDRARAIAHLFKKINHFNNSPNRYHTKKIVSAVVPSDNNKYIVGPSNVSGKKYFEPIRENIYNEPLKPVIFELIKPHLKSQFNQWEPLLANKYDYKPHPEIEFLDIHDKETGDLKSAKELRDGSGAIHGYYSSPEGLAQRQRRVSSQGLTRFVGKFPHYPVQRRS